MNTQKYSILYARLSREDGEDGISNSIKNQQELLTQYAEKNGFTPFVFLQDDGFTGANFDRPSWQELIRRVEDGEVSTILVKDGSRMARNYLQAGLYREMFRERGVRLICINDGTDTALGDDDFTPFREIMAEWYVRDCSRKVRSAYKTKGTSGKHLGSHALFGYKKSDSDKNLWVIDEPAAAVVRRIFAMTIEGYGPYAIANRLEAERVESPSYYLAQRDCGNSKNKDFTDPYRWWGTTVAYLLARMEYMGHTVNFKTIQHSYKNKRRFPNAKENMMVFENTHEPIISSETWATANRLRSNAKRLPTDMGEPRPLTGLLYCATCGAKLYNERTSPDSAKPKDNYICASYRKKTAECTAHRIKAADVETLVLETLRKVSGFALADEDGFKRKVTQMYSAKLDGEVKSQRKRLAACEKRRGELDKLIKKLFEEHALGSLTDKRFDLLITDYENEQAALETEIAELGEGIASQVDSAERAAGFLELAKRYRDFSKLSIPMLNECVERIVIHERSEKWCRHTTQQVDIYLSFIGNFETPKELSPEEERERARRDRRVRKCREYQREYQRRRAENGGKPLTPEDTRTSEEIAADDEARRKKWEDYNRDYQREYQRKLAREKRERKAADLTAEAAIETAAEPLAI